MLVLTRKLNEEVVIDDRITIRLLGVQGGKVRLGITAPDDVSIRRAELLKVVSADVHRNPAASERPTARAPVFASLHHS